MPSLVVALYSHLYFLIIKPTRCTNYSILFWNENLHVSDSFSVHHQEFFTVHTAMVYVIQVSWHMPLLCVQWKTPDDGQRNCPNHVEFHSKKINFENFVHLVGFIVRNLSRCTVTWTSNSHLSLVIELLEVVNNKVWMFSWYRVAIRIAVTSVNVGRFCY